MNRQFRVPRPNALWVSDFTYVATWVGFVYVAFVIDVFARFIVGWRSFAIGRDRLCPRCPGTGALPPAPFLHGLVHHSDRGSQYLSIKYTERLAEAGIEPSVGSVGDSYDNALAETVIGLPSRPKVIRQRGPWRHAEAVEFATLEVGGLVQPFDALLEPIGNLPPAEAEARYYAQIAGPAIAA